MTAIVTAHAVLVLFLAPDINITPGKLRTLNRKHAETVGLKPNGVASVAE
jgi:hypothetical protein